MKSLNLDYFTDVMLQYYFNILMTELLYHCKQAQNGRGNGAAITPTAIPEAGLRI